MFCTNCGKPVDKDSEFCIHCGNKIDYTIDNEANSENISEDDKKITNYYEYFNNPEEEKDKKEGENLEDEFKEDDELTTELVKITQTPLNQKNMNQEIDRLCGGFLSNETFTIKLLENGLDENTSNTHYKTILKNEIKRGHITSVEKLELRLDELIKMDVLTLIIYPDVKKRGTHNFRSQDDLNNFLGPSYEKKWIKKYNKKNPISVQEERKNKAKRIKEENVLNAKAALEKHENYLNELRETKTAKIYIPYGKGIGSSTAYGALTGDIMGRGAGTVLGGAMGAGDMLGALGGAATGGLILGGAGALIGGLMKAADDGIRWVDSVLVIKDEILTISGKFSLNLTDIDLVELGTYKNKDMITLTLNNRSMQFATPDGKALKIVLEECIEEAKMKGHEKQLSENTITTENNTSTADELIKYGELYKQGLLTEEEFNDIKKKLLNF